LALFAICADPLFRTRDDYFITTEKFCKALVSFVNNNKCEHLDKFREFLEFDTTGVTFKWTHKAKGVVLGDIRGLLCEKKLDERAQWVKNYPKHVTFPYDEWDRSSTSKRMKPY
jgi:hypothetical protein